MVILEIIIATCITALLLMLGYYVGKYVHSDDGTHNSPYYDIEERYPRPSNTDQYHPGMLQWYNRANRTGGGVWRRSDEGDDTLGQWGGGGSDGRRFVYNSQGDAVEAPSAARWFYEPSRDSKYNEDGFLKKD